MPTVFRSNGYRFFFYSNEGNEPCHVHVEGHGGEMKIWIKSMTVAESYGLSGKQQRQVIEIVKAHKQAIEEAWNAHFHS